MTRPPQLRSRSLRLMGIAGACILFAACNSRAPVFDNILSVGPTGRDTVLTPPIIPVSTVSMLTLTPQGTMGGGSGRGTVRLTLPAPRGGIPVTLSNADPMVSMPLSVSVPEGAESADFQFSTQSVSADRQVPIGASV